MATFRVPDDYPTITDALTHAHPGDTISIDNYWAYEIVRVNVDNITFTGTANTVGARLFYLEGVSRVTTGGQMAFSIDGNTTDNNVLIGNDAGNFIQDGYRGNDIIYGNGGNDVIRATGGHDELYGGDGDDLFQVYYQQDHTIVDGGAGVDTFAGDADFTTIDIRNVEILRASTATGTIQQFQQFTTFQSTSFDHLTQLRLVGTGGTLDFSNKTTGVDGIYVRDFGLTSAITVIGSANADILDGSAFGDTLKGGGGNDLFYSFDGDDKLYGGDGNDTFIGGNGNDLLDGGAGSDTAQYDTGSGVTVNLAVKTAQNTGGGGVDTLISIENARGSEFNDKLYGTAGDNVLSGRGGDDILRGGAGNDTLDGGDGVDTAYYNDARSGVSVDLNRTDAQDTCGAGVDTLNNVENLVGSNYTDVLIGNGNANRLTGGGGDDYLDGGWGKDALFGGAGVDAFVFSTELTGPYNVDRIMDFTPGTDGILLDHSIFAAAGALGALAQEAFRVGSAAADSSDRIIYNSATGALYYDPDGTGSAAQVRFATLTPGMALTAGSFIII